MSYTAENFIEFIEWGRTDKISQNGLKLIAEKFREQQQQLKNLNIPDTSSSLDVGKIKKTLEQYRDEEMPGWDTPFHHDAEGWAAMKYFIRWLESKDNDIANKTLF